MIDQAKQRPGSTRFGFADGFSRRGIVPHVLALVLLRLLLFVPMGGYSATLWISRDSPLGWSAQETEFEDLSWTAPGFDDSDWERGVGGVGYESAMALPRVRVLADTETDWPAAGEQGLHGWVAGFYQPATDPDGGFDFRRDFELDPNVWQFQSGTWTLGEADAPFLRMGANFCEWSTEGGAAGIWGVRRWISSHRGTAAIVVNGGSSGLTSDGSVRVMHNGRLLWRTYPWQSEIPKFSFQVEVVLEHGDTLDVAYVPPKRSGGASTQGAVVVAGMRVVEVLDEVDPVADSVADWITGQQGENGWNYGYYQFSGASDTFYDPSMLVLSGSTWNLIDDSWQLGSESDPRKRPPWDRISQQSAHPGTAAGHLRWVVRRWTSDQAGALYAVVSLSKQSHGGNGVTAHVRRNGQRIWTYTLPGYDTTGIRAVVPLGEVQPGDQIDFALDPRGTDGIAEETVDGTLFQAVVHVGTWDPDKDLAPFIDTTLPGVLSAERSVLYLRYPFVLDTAAIPDQLRLRVRHKDAFAAYLNGIPLPALESGELDESASFASVRSTRETLRPEVVHLDHLVPHLRRGTNVLCFRVLVAPDSFDSSVLQPELLANHAPEASTIHMTVEPPMDAVFSVTGVAQLAIDSDGDPLIFLRAVRSESTSKGAVVKVQRGWIRYTPEPGFSGDDSFLVMVADTSGLVSTGQVSVTVGPDVMPPRILSAEVSADRLQVVLRSSEPLSPELSEGSAFYEFSPPQSVGSIQIQPEASSITLSLAAPLSEEEVWIRVAGLRDGWGNAMNQQRVPVWQTPDWPVADPTPYRSLVETFALPHYHFLRFSYGEWLADYSADGDYLNMGKYIRFADAIHDSDGVPLYYNGNHIYNPSRVQIHALSMHGKALSGEEGAQDRFLAAVHRMLTLQDDRGAFLYPFDYLHHFNRSLLTAGWTSALAQGFGLSVLSRAYRLTGDERYIAAGEAALEYLLLSTDEGGPTTTLAALHPSLASYVWHEEWPVSPPPYTLNGFMFVLLGLYDWGELPVHSVATERAREAFQQGMATLLVVLPYFDLGGFTAYDLRHLLIGAPPLPASDYHAVHIGTIHALRRITHSRQLHEAELSWALQVERPTQLVAYGPSTAKVDHDWPLHVSVNHAGRPVERGTGARRDFMGDVLIDGLLVQATLEDDFISSRTDPGGEASFSLRIPPRYGEPTRATVDIRFGGWGEYQPSAKRLHMDVAGSGALIVRARSDDGHVTLDWDPHPAEWIEGYRIYRRDSPEGPFRSLFATALPRSTTSFEDVDVSPGGTYSYRITAIGVEEIDSDFSAEISLTLPIPNRPPVLDGGAVPDLLPLSAGTRVRLPLLDWFTDPDHDPLTFAAHSSQEDLLDLSLVLAELTLNPLRPGDAWITVSADDGHNPPLATSFRVLVYPQPHRLADGEFTFGHWDPGMPQGEYPEHMLFVQSDVNDPGLDTPLVFPYFIPEEDYHPDDSGTIGFPYNNTQGTRLNGLGVEGISLTNAGEKRNLGGVLLALDTREVDDWNVRWNAATIGPDPGDYGLRLQYRVGMEGPFLDVVVGGEPVEYIAASGPEAVTLEPMRLPGQALGQEHVQLLWRFHRMDGVGAQSQLRLDDIVVATFSVGPRDPVLVWPDPEPVRYGTALDDQQLNAVANVAGAFAYRPPVGTRFPVGVHRIDATFTPDDPIGYNLLTTSVALRVEPAPLVVRAEYCSRRYGEDNPPFSYVVDGLVCDDSREVVTGVVLRTQAGPQSPVGHYPINAEGGVALNYSVSHYGGLLTVLPGVPGVLWLDPAPVVYGTALSEEQLNAEVDLPGLISYQPPLGAVLPSGLHLLQMTFTPDDSLNYTSLTAQVELTVLEALPGITRHPASQIILRGNSVLLTVDVGGPGPFSYQWLLDGEPISDATGPWFEIEQAQPTDAGIYCVAVTVAFSLEPS
jgi:heparosan-N-sulfate-glucuronate 5-epimerase